MSSRGDLPADLILHGGTIHTMNNRQPSAEALAIHGDRFVAVGDSAAVMRFKSEQTQVVDLRGATVLPGLQDAHAHILGYGESLERLNLIDTRSFDEVLERVAAQARSARRGEWIVGSGWDQNDWVDPRWPTAAALDRVAPENPVFLTRIDGHAAVASTSALGQAGITAATADPPGGRILRDSDGRPSGVLIDAARTLVSSHIPRPTRAQIVDRILRADRELTRVGLTMVHDAGVSPDVLEVYQQLLTERRLNVRIYVMLHGDAADGWLQRGPLFDAHQRLTVRAIKLMADGALGSRGAALLEDYSDEPGTRGLMVTPAAVLYERTRAAAEAGFQTAIHAIGDRANREALDVYERVDRELPRARSLRPRIEHAQILDGTDIPRFAALGVIASIQAVHCTSDMPWAPRRLGDERVAEGAYVWRRLLESGAILANGSDAPVERPHPLEGIYAAITRQSLSGTPAGGWMPQERLTAEEAVRALTVNAAYAAHAERDLGSIEVGKLADLVVVSRDILRIAPADIPGTQILRTVIGGRTAFERESLHE
jgi:predicted amidohydrolase YtcJ